MKAIFEGDGTFLTRDELMELLENLAGDMEGIEQFVDTILRQIAMGDIDSASEVFHKFLQRAGV